MKETNIWLEHILENIVAIEKYIKNKTKQQFIDDIQLQDSVLRRLEITGEAVKNLPVDFRKLYLYIPWEKIAGMRDILIHEYFGVDIPLVWSTLKKDLPFLKREIKKLLQEVE